jgi:hypothetical protein
MKLATIALAALSSLAITGLHAQSMAQAEPAAQAPARDTPPDQKAYQDAVKITDAAPRIKALEEFRNNFPDSPNVAPATMAIFSTLAHKMPDQQKRIRDFGRNVYGNEKDKKTQVSLANELASNLLDANVLPKEAKRYATISLNGLDQASYLKDQHDAFEKRKAANPAARPTSD